MSVGRSDREEEVYRLTVYEGTDTLRNKLGILDAQVLDSVERRLTKERVREGLPEEATHPTIDGLKAIHHHLLQDVYEWAGEFRRYTTGRGPAPFAVPEQIEPYLAKTFGQLAAENDLKGLNADDFAARSAHYVSEINAVHPFIDGNGRTQRLWLRNMADRAGYKIELESGDRDAWNAASRHGFAGYPEPMAHLIASRITPLIEQAVEKEANEQGTQAPRLTGPPSLMQDRDDDMDR